MKRPTKLLTLLFLSHAFSACDPVLTDHLTIVNNSDVHLYMQVVGATDTVLDCNPRNMPPEFSDYAPPRRTSKYPDGPVVGDPKLWRKFVRDHGYLTVLVVDNAIYNKYWNGPCDTLHKYVPILHRYQLTMDELDKTDWTIVYPPEEEE